MWIENKIYREDLENLVSDSCIPWEDFREARFFITGGTGLIGSTLISSLVFANLKLDLHIHITALVRNIDKARMLFNVQLEVSNDLEFIQGNIEELPDIGENYDYIVHAASPTASKFFAFNPVETIKIAVGGTQKLLDAAKAMNLKGFAYLSSMEVYGSPTDEMKIRENSPLYIDLSSPRSSYPSSKCLCESLCASYCSEYGVPTRSLRLAQTFGVGMDYNDSRLIGQLLRSVIEKKNIVLYTMGESKQCYLYSFDAVSAILLLLVKGKNGLSYNVANPETYSSIYDMAQLVANKCGNGSIGIEICIDENANKIYSAPHKIDLDISRLTFLGWSPRYGLKSMFDRTIAAFNKSSMFV